MTGPARPVATGGTGHGCTPAAVAAARAHIAAAMYALAGGYPPSVTHRPVAGPSLPAIVAAARRRLDEVENALVAALGLLQDYERTVPPAPERRQDCRA